MIVPLRAISIIGICDHSAPEFLASRFMPTFLFALISYYSDIDECSSSSHNCSNHATCINTAGHFNCSCKAGYAGDGNVCLGTISPFLNKIIITIIIIIIIIIIEIIIIINLQSANYSMYNIKKSASQ